MMAAGQKCMTGKLLEEKKTSKTLGKEADQQQDGQPETEAEGTWAIVETSAQEQEPMLDFRLRKSDGSLPDSEKLPKVALGFQN